MARRQIVDYYIHGPNSPPQGGSFRARQSLAIARYHRYANEKWAGEEAYWYEIVEHEAQAKRVGLSADGHPIPTRGCQEGERQ